MANWFHCDNLTGAIAAGGMAPTEADARLQTAPEGRTLYVLSDGLVANPFSPSPDFSALKASLLDKIDADAGAIRLIYITDIPGQAQTYEKKEAEARRWQEGDDAADYPFMAAEATARGVDIEQVRDEIIAQVNALTPRAALIEAHRLAAKERVRSGATLPAILAASEIDWEAALS